MEQEPRYGNAKIYNYRGKGKSAEPNYTRTAEALTRAELIDEIDAGRGSVEYQDALRRELDRRR